MELSRPEVTWANVKNDISRMQKCLVESLKTCDQLEQGHLTQLKIELTAARKRIYELEYENATLRTHLQVGNNVGNLSASRFTGGGMPESLQAEVDQHLLRAKEENDRLRQRISDLEVQAECLKEQINVYKEDFEMERKDRENAQSLITDLQKRLALLTGSRHHLLGNCSPTSHHHHQSRSKIRGFDVCDDVSSVSGRQNTIVYTAVDGGHLGNADHGFDVCDLRESDVDQGSLGLNGRGFSSVSKFHSDGSHENDSVAAERFSRMSPPLPTDAGRAVHNLSFNIRSPFQTAALSESLSCPNCRKIFSTEDHMLLLEHLEVCN